MTFNDSRWEQERKARMGRAGKQEHKPTNFVTHMTGPHEGWHTQGSCTCGWSSERINGVGQWPSCVVQSQWYRHLEENGVPVPQSDKAATLNAQRMMEPGYQFPKRSIWDRLFGWIVPQP